MQRKKMTEEEMRELCDDILPHIEKIKEAVMANRPEEGVRIYISRDYVSVEGSGLCGWELHNYSGKYEMKFEKRVPLRKPICTCAECGEAVYEQGDWDFDDAERIPVCRNCGAELQLPEGY